ncbi:hypothetical protein LMH73_002480 [Vibrio splendidus]|nr:hypothetical protein [Vibrio splendidus]MCC4880449.1 hypothetical protein [Vibrio splendidus]
MNKSVLTNKIRSIYSDFMSIQDRYINKVDEHSLYLINESTEKLVSAMDGRDLSDELKVQIQTLIDSQRAIYDAQKLKRDSNKVTRESVDSSLDSAVSEYQRAVSVFTSNGGKDFYDVVTSISNVRGNWDNNRSHLHEVEDVINSLREKGHDIQEIYRSDDDLSVDGAERFAIMMPSSSYTAFQEALESANEHFVETGFNERPLLVSFDTSFILPHAVDTQVTIDTVREHLAESGERISTAASSLGYLRSSLPYQGFESKNWDHLKNAMTDAMGNMAHYSKEGYHCNGLMPTPYVYSEKSKGLLGLDENSKVVVNVVHDIQKHELLEKKSPSLDI